MANVSNETNIKKNKKLVPLHLPSIEKKLIRFARMFSTLRLGH